LWLSSHDPGIFGDEGQLSIKSLVSRYVIQSKEEASLLRRRLESPVLRVFLLAYSAAYLLVILGLGTNNLRFLCSPLLFVFVWVADYDTHKRKPILSALPKAKSESIIFLIPATVLLPLIIVTTFIRAPQLTAELIVHSHLVASLASTLLFIVPVILVWHLGGYEWGDFGVTSKSRASSRYLIGVYIVIAAYLLFQQSFNQLRTTPLEIIVLGVIIQFFLVLLLNVVPEELAFRGLLQDRLVFLVGDQERGLLLTSILFALFHVPAMVITESAGFIPLMAVPFCLVVFSPMGLTLGILYHRSKSLMMPIAIHTLHNWGSSVLVGTLIAFLLFG
jgi:membrane protease YdiL (CAAX protease family)